MREQIEKERRNKKKRENMDKTLEMFEKLPKEVRNEYEVLV